MLAAMPAQIAATLILQMNYNVAQIKVSTQSLWSRVSERLKIPELSLTLPLKGVRLVLTSSQTVTESGLTSHFPAHGAGHSADLRPSVEAAAGCAAQEGS